MDVENQSYGGAVIRGTAWRYLTFFSGKLMVLVSSVVLARLLSRDDFGVVGYAITAIALLDVLSDLGVSPAVIYHPEDDRTATTAFWLEITVGVFLCVIVWLAAPLVGSYFKDIRAVNVTRVLAFSFPINALGHTHEAILRKRLLFNRIFIPDLFQSITKGVVSIGLALMGAGAWSLIFGQLSGMVVGVFLLWYVTPWRPSLSFKPVIANSLLSYGLRIVGVDVVAVLLLNVDYLLVGRYLGAEALGVYTIAFRMPELLILQFSRILSSVIFPIYTQMRNAAGGLAKAFYLTTRYVSLITVPLGMGLALVSRPFVLTVFSSKWADAIPVIQGISIYAMFLSFTYNVGSIYKAEGRPQVLTWLGLMRFMVLFPALWWAVVGWGSIVAVGWIQAFVALLGTLLNFYVASRLLDLSLWSIMESLLPSFVSGLFMTLSVAIILFVVSSFSPWIQLAAGILSGSAVYIGTLWLFQRDLILDFCAKIVNSRREASV